jgi:Tol biopolymer transport system component
VKVLDFGLAKATGPNLPDLPTITVDATRILGTTAYMSPEQARGRPVDTRTDIWAFGCVLYEMLTGRAAFDRATFSDTVAAIIEREPDWSALPASTPVRLCDLLRRSVVKNPKMRLQSIGDARVQIDELISGAAEETLAGGSTQPHAHRSARFATIVAGISLVIAAALAVPVTLYFRRVVPEPLPTRFEIATPPTSDPVSFALSDDGRQLAFVAMSEGTSHLWVRPLDQVTARPLPGTEGASYPFWAPDGRAIGFFADGKLKRIDPGGGALQVLADAPNGRGGTWNRDGVLVFDPTGSGALMRVTGGRTPVPATPYAPGQGSQRWPQFLPDGRHFLFWWGNPGRPDATGVYVGSLDGGEPTRVLAAGTAAVYASGALLWVHEGVLVAQRFDPAHKVIGDERIPVAQAVGVNDAAYRGAFAVSATGVLAHRVGQGQRRQLNWVDRAGIERGTVGPPDETGLGSPELAPDGLRVAVHRTVEGNQDVFLIDTGRDVSNRFTFDTSIDAVPLWSADGKRVVFASMRNGVWNLFEKAANGTGDERPLLVTPEHKWPLSWSRDGQFLLYDTQHPKTGIDLWALPLGGDRKPFLIVQTLADEMVGQLSPDGRWVAYQSNESRTAQVWVRPFPGPGAPTQLTTAGGSQPRWRPDGKELFYVAADARLMAVPISVGVNPQALEHGAPVPLFRTRLATGANIGRSSSMRWPLMGSAF